ncbi:MAG: hypothetical protein E7637_01090 [Ruminococcaceae bacterium]|nr:hypothetical protein [Oscillospiraceae bacterium]
MEQDNVKNPLFLRNLPSGAVTHCEDCDEESFCNCENNEQITPFYSDGDPRRKARTEEGHKHKKSTAAYQKVKKSCSATLDRLTKDWKETKGNPCIKQTAVYRMDVYKTPSDEHPIDSFGIERCKTYSLRALALLGIAAAALICTADILLGKIWK